MNNIFEQSRYFFNDILPDKIINNLESFNYFLSQIWWIFFILMIIFLIISMKSFGKNIEIKKQFENKDNFLQKISNISNIKDLGEYILIHLPTLLNIKFISIYNLKGSTYILMDTNMDENNSKVSTPLRINKKGPSRFKKSGNFFVNHYISQDKEYLLLLFSHEKRDFSKYDGFLNIILGYYNSLLKNYKLKSGETLANINQNTSISLIKLQMDKYQFFQFFIALILKITKAEGAKLLTKDGENIFEYFTKQSNNVQKIFYIRNTPYKLEFYNNKPLEHHQMSQIGSFLDLAGGFLVNMDKNSEMIKNYLDLLNFTNQAIELENIYYNNHSKIVQTVSVEIAKSLFLSEEEIDNISLGAYLHDIGMIGDLSLILNKNELEKRELDLIKEHPIIGSIMVEPISHIYPISNIIKYHHERFDGRGYPFGLKESEIPTNSQIVALGEYYAGITGDRAYRKGKTHQEAIENIKKMKNKMFNPIIINAFLDIQKSLEVKILKLRKKI